jgi:hypothetical protein
MALQAFSYFFARSMHGQRGNVSAQAHRQVTALPGSNEQPCLSSHRLNSALVTV